MKRLGIALISVVVPVVAIMARPEIKQNSQRENTELAKLAQKEDKKHLLIRWRGHSMFEITSSKGTQLLLDPHLIEKYGAKKLKTDLLIITHPHNDHNQARRVDGKPGKRIDGVKRIGLNRQQWLNGKYKYKDLSIQMIGNYHDEDKGAERGLNAMAVLDVDGYRIVHLGDLGHRLSKQQLRELGKVDILMIPVGGIYTLNGADAKKVQAQIKPRHYIFPMHFGTPVFDSLLDEKEFLDGQKPGTVVRRTKTNELKIPLGAPVPKDPKIMLLDWENRS